MEVEADVEVHLNWPTIDDESFVGRDWPLSATGFISAGSHYATNIDLLCARGSIVGRAARGPYRVVEVSYV